MAEAVKAAGGQTFALSVDGPEESRAVVERYRLPFPILCDTKREVLQAYSLVHEGGGPGGSDVAVPAHLLIDREGHVVWRHVAKRVQDRPDPKAEAVEVREKLARSG